MNVKFLNSNLFANKPLLVDVEEHMHSSVQVFHVSQDGFITKILEKQ